MGLHGCSATRELDDRKFSEPMPWIGLYIAGASLACSFAMGMDTFYAFRRRKLWFPCKFFSLNATSLTLLSIATKLPVDLNTSMPSREDQLTKLSSTILICTAMGNFMTSLGTMEKSELLSNVVALAILVITVIVNVGIQMGTGVIYALIPEHAIIMFFMILLLIMLVFSALTIPTAQQLLKQQYEEKKTLPLAPGYSDGVSTVDALKEFVTKYWMLTHTCRPQYFRLATCTTAGAISSGSALILLEASVRSFISSSFCSGESDYTWSIKYVFISQVIAVVVGSFALGSRRLNAIFLTSPESLRRSYRAAFKVEGYWIQRLVDWKESPLPFRIGSRLCRKIIYVSKFKFLDAFIGMQTELVLFCKWNYLSATLPLRLLIRPFSCCLEGFWGDTEPNQLESENLKEFVLHLEGEDELVDLMMKSCLQDTEQFIERGWKNRPTHLITLLQSFSSEGFKGVAEFDSDQVPTIGEKLPNCWALPVVTLTSIAVALPNMDQNIIRSLREAVDEGLRYARLVDQGRLRYARLVDQGRLRYARLVDERLSDNLLSNMWEAADIVWRGTDIYDRWLDNDLHKLVAEEKIAKNIIKKLTHIGSESVLEFAAGDGPWPAKVLAANSMYRIGKTIMEEQNDKLDAPDDPDELFRWLRTTIADILGACLTNLPRVISMACICSSIEVREDRVRDAAYLLGEAGTILDILREHESWVQHLFPDMDPDKKADIDEWRLRMNGV